MHYIALQCLALRCTTLDCIAFHHTALHYIASSTLHCIALNHTDIPCQYIALHCTTLNCTTLHYLHTTMFKSTLVVTTCNYDKFIQSFSEAHYWTDWSDWTLCISALGSSFSAQPSAQQPSSSSRRGRHAWHEDPPDFFSNEKLDGGNRWKRSCFGRRVEDIWIANVI